MKSKNNILRILESLGYLFPSDEESVIEFEKKYKKEIEEIKPKHWENPAEILKQGKMRSILPENNKQDSLALEGLAQAAREGKQIPEDMKRKMLEDRNGAKDTK